MNKIQPRHWTFIGLFVLIVIVMLIQVDMKLETSAQTQKMFDYIENLPPNSVILVSFDHEASSLPEIKPIGLALCRHAFSKGHKIIGLALFAEGTVIGYRLLQQTAKEYDLEYGQDYVFLGFKPQFIAAISSLGESFSQTFPEDYIGNDYDSIPMLKEIKNYDDIAAVLSIADGNLTTHWMEYGGSRFNVTVLGGITAAMVTSYDPYISSGQMLTMIAGLRGAAEYEQLINKGGSASRSMLAQTSSHLYILLLIIIGNVMYFRSKKKGES